MGGQEYLTRFGHLGRKELVAYAEGEELGARSSEHLETCLECQSRVANLRVKSLWHPETEIFPRYAEGDLPPDEVKVFEGHVAACASCQELLTSVTDAEKLLRKTDMSSSEFEPPRTLPSAIAEKLDLETSEAGTLGEEDERSIFSNLPPRRKRKSLPKTLEEMMPVVRAKLPGKPSRSFSAKDLLQEAPDCQGVWQMNLSHLAKGTRSASAKHHEVQLGLWRRDEAPLTTKGQGRVFESRRWPGGHKDTLTAQQGNLQCAVRADTEPGRPGTALTVSVSYISGKEAPGILVVLHSKGKIVDRLTDTTGRVVFSAVTGSVTLQFGKAKFSLKLNS